MTQQYILHVMERTVEVREAGWKARLVVIGLSRYRVEFFHPRVGTISGPRVGQKHHAFVEAVEAVAPYLERTA